MPVFDENDKDISNLEGFTKYMETQHITKKEGPMDKIRNVVGRIPWLSVALLVLIVIVGVMVFSLNLRLTALRAEMEETKGIRAEMTNLQSGVDAKIEAFNREKAGLRSEVAQLRNELESMKSMRKKAESDVQKQQASAAKKKPAPKKNQPKERR